MSGRIWYYEATIPAGTPLASPWVVDLATDVGAIERIDMLVPAGPHGNLGFALLYGNGQVYPFQSDAWVIADDVTLVWSPDSGLSSGAWSLEGYNLGSYDHTVYVTLTAVSPAALGAGATVITPVAVG